MRNVLVHPELQPLRIDHDHPHIVRRRAVEDARQHRVDADRLAGAGRAGDQQVRHRARDRRCTARRESSCRARSSASTSSAGTPRTRAARAAKSARGCGSGIWMPTVDLPGMRSIRTDSACIARHRSSARPVIFEYFTPASGLNSNVVTTGPGWIWTTMPSTENSRHFSSSSRAPSISSRSSILRSVFGASSSASGGSV